ncbi:two component transcriptional regulator winged helix family [Roseburia sp. CAG:303]|nr:two component transcriptional regulator winged helix family [Roseburia sp. CAG:303]
MSRLLIIEDDVNINEMLQEAFGKKGYEVVSAYSGTEGILRIEKETYQMVILDLMLPGMDGQQVLKNIREKSNVPVIVLSAKDELDTKVDLLMSGASDYMTKPFELKELEVRVLVQLRNAAGKNEVFLEYRDLRIDREGKKVILCGKPLSLTAQEYRILELLLKHPQKVFTKNEIYEYAWEEYYMGEDKTINVHISNIRQKMKKITQEEYIETVWGMGFKLAE